MKYLKAYEGYGNLENCYWKVRTTTPHFEISLDKMGMVEDEKEDFIQMRDEKYRVVNQDYVYIALNYNGGMWQGTVGSEFYYDKTSRDYY